MRCDKDGEVMNGSGEVTASTDRTEGTIRMDFAKTGSLRTGDTQPAQDLLAATPLAGKCLAAGHVVAGFVRGTGVRPLLKPSYLLNGLSGAGEAGFHAVNGLIHLATVWAAALLPGSRCRRGTGGAAALIGGV